MRNEGTLATRGKAACRRIAVQIVWHTSVTVVDLAKDPSAWITFGESPTLALLTLPVRDDCLARFFIHNQLDARRFLAYLQLQG